MLSCIMGICVMRACIRKHCYAAVCRHLEWDDDEHSVVLKSTHCKPQHNNQRDHCPLMALAIMSVWPLQFTALIEVHKKVTYAVVNYVPLNYLSKLVIHLMTKVV